MGLVVLLQDCADGVRVGWLLWPLKVLILRGWVVELSQTNRVIAVACELADFNILLLCLKRIDIFSSTFFREDLIDA